MESVVKASRYGKAQTARSRAASAPRPPARGCGGATTASRSSSLLCKRPCRPFPWLLLFSLHGACPPILREPSLPRRPPLSCPASVLSAFLAAIFPSCSPVTRPVEAPRRDLRDAPLFSRLPLTAPLTLSTALLPSSPRLHSFFTLSGTPPLMCVWPGLRLTSHWPSQGPSGSRGLLSYWL